MDKQNQGSLTRGCEAEPGVDSEPRVLSLPHDELATWEIEANGWDEV